MSSKISKRKQMEKMDRHTELCLKNFYAVLGLALSRLGYSEDDLMKILMKMDEIYGIETDFVRVCKEEAGVEIRI